MKVFYRIPIKPKSVISTQPRPSSAIFPADVAFGRVEVEWEVDTGDNNYITTLTLIASQAPLRMNAAGSLIAEYPDLIDPLFRVASYLADVVLARTGIDTVNPDLVRSTRPTIEPETPEEVKAVENSSLSGTAVGVGSVTGSLSLSLDPSGCVQGFRHAVAWASYATALRVQSPFVQFEQFFKVVEYFSGDKDGGRLDTFVSEYASQYDASFSADIIRGLREVRIRSIHPCSKKIGPHLSPHSPSDIRVIQGSLGNLRTLAELLLRNPPSP